MGKYLIAHDLGTSGNKASLFSTSGQLIDSCTIPYEVHFSDGTVQSRIRKIGGMRWAKQQEK